MAEKAPGVGSNITDICIMTPQKTIDFPRDKIGNLHKIYQKRAGREPDWASDFDALLKEIENLKK
ncbi:MAG: hypothetical protein U9O41_09890 [Candidatus Aerophobetes bacterium]|nr:hypothetical protein [Candidatus Aerophobetes bacterium]